MAIKYKREEEVLSMIARSSIDQVAPRLSELRSALFGDRGGNYDQIKYWRNAENGEIESQGERNNEKLSDLNIMRTYSDSNRSEERMRLFWEAFRFD